MIKWIFGILGLFLVSCAPTRHVIPLAKKERAVSISVGGPITVQGNIAAPEPIVNITYAYGKTKRLTYITGVQISPILEGFYAAEFGMLREWWFHKEKNMGITTNVVANLMTDRFDGGIDFYPQLDANFYWHFHGDPHYWCNCPGDGNFMQFIYAGFGSWYKVTSDNEWKAPFNEDVIFAPHFGYNFGSKRWKLNVELKWLQPWVDNTQFEPTIWNPISKVGTFGAHLSFYKMF